MPASPDTPDAAANRVKNPERPASPNRVADRNVRRAPDAPAGARRFAALSPRAGAARTGRLAAAALLPWLAGLAAPPVAAQPLLDRSPNLSGGWVGLPGYFYADLSHRFRDARPEAGLDIDGSSTFLFVFGLPHGLHVGAAAAPDSDVEPGETDEWEAHVRWAALTRARAAPFDLTVTGAYNGASGSVDGALGAARWFGPIRVLAEARAFSEPYGGGDARFAVAGGAVLHVKPGGLPVAVAADVGTLFDRDAGEAIVWGAGVHLGLPHTDYTFAVQASNAVTTTLEGAARGRSATRLGFQLAVPAPIGVLLGMFPPREAALEAVAGDAPAAGDVIRVPIRLYAFQPTRITVAAGTTVEWVNEDVVVHTATAHDGAWDSGAIPPGQTWRARFDRPGRYPYFCAPHPFMQAMVIVR
jgi:plastocyanin